jgi:hypothetical protein
MVMFNVSQRCAAQANFPGVGRLRRMGCQCVHDPKVLFLCPAFSLMEKFLIPLPLVSAEDLVISASVFFLCSSYSTI